MGKEGEVLAVVLSFCLQGHSCLIGGSHCRVWHRCSLCVCVCVYVGGNASQLPCDGTFRRVFMRVVDPVLSHTTEGAALCQQGENGLQVKVEKET